MQRSPMFALVDRIVFGPTLGRAAQVVLGPPRAPRRAPRWWAAGLLVLGALALSACRASEAAPRRDSPVAVRVAPVTRQPVVQSLRYVGTTRFEREIVVRAQLAGTLVALPVAEGQTVRPGDILARIDAPDVGARVSRVGSELRRAEAERAHACEVFARDERLHAERALAKAALDVSRKACELAREGGSAAEAQLTELRAVHGKAVERALREGIVLEWRAEPGENVGPGQPLLVLGSGALEVEVQVAEGDLRDGVTLDTPAELRLGGRWQPGQVLRIAPLARGAARAVEVRLSLPEQERARLRAGMSLDARFITAQAKDASTVPMAAIAHGPEGAAIFVVAEGHARRQPVVPGIAADGRVALDVALEPGTEVAVSNVEQLADGARLYAVAEEKSP